MKPGPYAETITWHTPDKSLPLAYHDVLVVVEDGSVRSVTLAYCTENWEEEGMREQWLLANRDCEDIMSTFEINARDWNRGLCPFCADDCNGTPNFDKYEHDYAHVGWYYQCGSGNASGPFETEALALDAGKGGKKEQEPKS